MDDDLISRVITKLICEQSTVKRMAAHGGSYLELQGDDLSCLIMNWDEKHHW